MVTKMVVNMFKLKIDPNVVVFGFCCEVFILNSEAILVILENFCRV